MIERPHFISADAQGISKPVEMFSLEKQRNRLVVSADLDLKDTVLDITETARYWLPLAAESLCISPDLKDYVLVPVISIVSDIPNRNAQSFSYETLTNWVPDRGSVMFRTWNGAPCFVEHANTDHTKASGIIFATLMRPVPNTQGSLHKVIKLSGWDRKKNPILANDILNGVNRSFSMGATARDFSCSVCGSIMSKGGCEHVNYGNPTYKLFGKKLAYWNILDPVALELSRVRAPAYMSAKDMPLLGQF